jgi:flagellar hook-associated protein 1 FlgK
LFDALDTARSGLVSSQQGIRTVGHNIANVNTPGFSRQRQDLAATSPTRERGQYFGTGVETTSVTRAHDAFLERQLLSQSSRAGSADAQARQLALLENVFNEQGGQQLGASLGQLYDAFADLAAAPNPGASVEREALRAAAVRVADTLHGADAALRDQQNAVHSTIAVELDEINGILARIEGLNREIALAEVHAPANDLRDQQDLLVRNLARHVEVDTYRGTNGQVNVVLPSGFALVEGPEARSLVLRPDPANPFGPHLGRVFVDSGNDVVDITGEIGGGQLGGLLRARDTLIAGAIRELDTVAFNLTETVNAVHGGGLGLDGSSGNFFASLTAVENAARDIAIDPAIAASTDAIAAGLTTEPGDNRNAAALAGLRSEQQAIFQVGDPPGPATGPSRSVLSQLAAATASVGQQARSMSQSSDQQAAVLLSLDNQREAVSGVSIDEEVTRLIRLQAAFEANARVIGTIDSMIDDLMSIL